MNKVVKHIKQIRDLYPDGTYGKDYYQVLIKAFDNTETELENYRILVALANIAHIQSKSKNETVAGYGNRHIFYLDEILRYYSI